MQKLARRLLRLLLWLLVPAALAVVTVYILTGRRMAQRWDITPAAVVVPTDAAGRIEGERLFVARGCADCHGADLGGAVVVDDFMGGLIAGPNLTTGAGGIGARADLDLVRAIRHGVAPDGRALIFMPAHEFNVLSDSEVGPMIAAIRAAEPVDRIIPLPRVGPLMRLLFLLGQVPMVVSAEQIEHQAPRPPSPAVAPTPAYGAYLANLCVGCHGPGLSGGSIPGVPPDWPAASNLTSDPSGLAGWSEADFVRAMRQGIRHDGSAIDPVMPWRNFARMTDTELGALWQHLHALAPRAAGGR